MNPAFGMGGHRLLRRTLVRLEQWAVEKGVANVNSCLYVKKKS